MSTELREPFHVYTISHPTLQSAKRRAKGKRAKGERARRRRERRRRQMAPRLMAQSPIHQMMKTWCGRRRQDLVSGQRVVGGVLFCHSALDMNWYNLVRCEPSILFLSEVKLGEEESKKKATDGTKTDGTRSNPPNDEDMVWAKTSGHIFWPESCWHFPFCRSALNMNWYNLVRCELSILFLSGGRVKDVGRAQRVELGEEESEESKMSAELTSFWG